MLGAEAMEVSRYSPVPFLFAEEPELIAWAAELEGLDELNQLDEWGRSLLCQAARNQDENGVRIVLEKGADPNLHDTSDRGAHPLMCALTNQSSSTKGDRGMEYLRSKLQLAA